jgi:hypothetical protein
MAELDTPSQIPPEIEKLAGQSGALVDGATGYARITSVAEKQAAAAHLKQIKDLEKRLTEERLTITRPMDAAKNAVMNFFKKPLDRLAAARLSCDSAIQSFDREQERLRQEEVRRRERVAAEERARLEAEARAKEEAANQKAAEERRKAEELRTQGKAAQAARLESKAESRVETAANEAESIRAVASTVEATEVEDTTKVEGLTTRWNYDGEVVDMLALAKAIVASNGVFPPITLLVADKKLMKAQAVALKDKFEGAYPGCKLVKTPINVSR